MMDSFLESSIRSNKSDDICNMYLAKESVPHHMYMYDELSTAEFAHKQKIDKMAEEISTEFLSVENSRTSSKSYSPINENPSYEESSMIYPKHYEVVCDHSVEDFVDMQYKEADNFDFMEETHKFGQERQFSTFPEDPINQMCNQSANHNEIQQLVEESIEKDSSDQISEPCIEIDQNYIYTLFEDFLKENPHFLYGEIVIKKKKISKKKEYPHKNFLKIFGQKIISFIEKGNFEKRLNILSKFLHEEALITQEECGFDENTLKKFDVLHFKKWIKEQDLKKKYTKLSTFRSIWRATQQGEDATSNVFRKVLTKLSKKFLEEDLYMILIENKGSKKIKEEKLKVYLDMIPKMLEGIEHPESFMSLG